MGYKNKFCSFDSYHENHQNKYSTEIFAFLPINYGM